MDTNEVLDILCMMCEKRYIYGEYVRVSLIPNKPRTLKWVFEKLLRKRITCWLINRLKHDNLHIADSI